jgi:ABC-2 type transport system permease protein
MQAYRTLVRRELGAFFLSWTGYIVIACVVLLLGASFVSLLMALNGQPTDRPLPAVFFSTYYFVIILLLAPPVITMRSFALEKSSGTFETLMTAPVSDLQVVLAKFTGAMLFYLLTWLPLLPCLLIVRHYSDDKTVLDAGSLAGMSLGILLPGAAYIAVGCLASALTRSQIIAAMFAFAIGAALLVLSFLAPIFTVSTGWKAQFFTQVGLIEHMKDFASGVLDTRPLVLYPSLTALFLFLTHKVVESRRWK